MEEEQEEEEETQKFHKEKTNNQQQNQFSPSAISPLKNLNPNMSSRSSLHSIPPTTIDSPPDSPTLSSIPDSHGSSPHTIAPTPSVASVATKTETPFRVINGDLVDQKISESRRQLRPSYATPRESNWGSFIRKALLGFRVSAFCSCLVSFSLMVADRDKGWARDSFYNYKEFRFMFVKFTIH